MANKITKEQAFEIVRQSPRAKSKQVVQGKDGQYYDIRGDSPKRIRELLTLINQEV